MVEHWRPSWRIEGSGMSASRRDPGVRRPRRGGVAGPPTADHGSAGQATQQTVPDAPSRSPAKRLERMMEVSPAAREVAELGLVVYTPAGFDRFLSTPLAIFDGRTALDLLESDQAEPVLAALAADYEGLGY